jgi:hypothetical protein
MDGADGQRGAGSTLGSSKGKEKVVTSESTPNVGSWSPPRDAGASTEPTASA